LGGSRSVGFGANQIRSLADAVAYALAQFTPVGIQRGPTVYPPVEYDADTDAEALDYGDLEGLELNPLKIMRADGLTLDERQRYGITEMWPEDNVASRIAAERYAPVATITRPRADICPQCGNATLVRSEGCKHCENPLCGHSEC
jgi:hypothetical protein